MRYSPHPTTPVFPLLNDRNLNCCIVCLEKHGCSTLFRTGDAVNRSFSRELAISVLLQSSHCPYLIMIFHFLTIAGVHVYFK